jgi:hypothetical protein
MRSSKSEGTGTGESTHKGTVGELHDAHSRGEADFHVPDIRPFHDPHVLGKLSKFSHKFIPPAAFEVVLNQSNA